jgi:hypothetical protein
LGNRVAIIGVRSAHLKGKNYETTLKDLLDLNRFARFLREAHSNFVKITYVNLTPER